MGLFAFKPFSAEAAETNFAGGDGSQGDPYQIETAEQLKLLADNVNNGTTYSGNYFKLMNDITLTDEWTPIGLDKNKSVFQGNFDGSYHTITMNDVTISYDYYDYTYTGLFGYCSGSTIENLIVGGTITITTNRNRSGDFGGIVGYAKGTVIKNCGFIGTVNSGNENAHYMVGGIAAYLEGSITNCFNAGNITVLTYEFGGIVSELEGDAISCYNIGNLTNTISSTYDCGGIVASLTGRDIDNGATIKDCYNAGIINSPNRAGGIVGELYNGIVINCYNSGDVTGGSYTGGIAAENVTASNFVNRIENCYNTGTVNNTNDSNFLSSILGYNPTYYNVTITNCYFSDNSGSTVLEGTAQVGNSLDQQTFFTDTLTWDFSGTWAMSDWLNRPVLKDNCFTVTLDCNDDEGTTEDHYVDYGGAYGELPEPARDGYDFDGWFTEKTDGSKVTSNTGSITSNHTLYAQWTKSSYAVTITPYKDGSEWNNSEKSYKLSSDNGSTFVTDLEDVPDGEYKIYETDGTDTGVTVEVNGEDASAEVNYYTVTFYDGTTAYTTPAPQIILSGETAAKPTDPSKTGYTFSKWVTEQNGSTEFSFSTAITKTTSIYAGWTANKITVSFDPRGGSSVSDIEVTFDSEYGGLPDTARTGYKFDGWYTSATGGTEVKSDTKVTNASPHTLYAKWTANTYTAVFDANGGGWDGTLTQNVDQTYDSKWKLPSAEPTRVGYDFAGWWTGSAAGTQITSDDTYTTDDEETVYAHWTAQQYNITYMDEGSAAFSGTHESGHPTTHTYGTETPLKAATKTGYDFKGWYTEPACTNKVTTIVEDAYTEDFTLYAKWTANKYEVTLDYQDGRTGTLEVEYDSTYIGLPEKPARDGYTFVAWHSEAGTTVTSSTKVTTADNHTLYAQWKAGEFEITFDYNGADGGITDRNMSVTFGEIYSGLPKPTKTGDIFAGWFTENGKQIKDGDTVEITENTTLYAHWTECDHSNGRWGNWTYDADSHSHVCLDCGKTVTEEHKYSDWTKQDETYHTRICECGRTDTAVHSWDRSKGTVTVQPTCTAMGTTTYPCIDGCGAAHDEIDVDMIPHNFSGAWIEDVNGDGHYRKCEVCSTPSDTIPHNWNEGTFTLGNCTTRSQTDFVCNSCGAEKTEYGEIVSDVHDWRDNGYNEEGHHLECSRCGETEVSDHIWDEGTVDFEPTCVSKGQLTLHCTVEGCSETKTVEIDINPDAHKWSSEWQSDENGHWYICENDCGQTYSAVHTWDNGETITEATCTEAGEIRFTCTDCGYSRTEAAEPKGHDFGEAWSFDENGHWHECSRDYVADGVIPHTEKEIITIPATPTTDGLKTYICDDCGYEIRTEVIPATGEETPPTEDREDPSDGKDPGNITVDSKSGENAPDVSISGETSDKLKEEVIASHLTPEEKAAVADGDNIDIILMVEDAGDTVPVSDKQAAETVITGSDYTLGQYLNIDMLKFINGQEAGKITRLNSPISITIEVPENMRNANRAFVIVRIHEGKADILNDTDSDPDTITIMTDRFSTYAIAYQDTRAANPGNHNTGTTTPISGTADNSSPDSDNTSKDSNSAGEDVSSAAGSHQANELLDEIVPENRASVTMMIVTIGVILTFIIKKRMKFNK